MSTKRKSGSRVIATVVGGVLCVGAIASVFLIDWERTADEHQEPIRPLKTAVVGDAPPPLRTYPARVRARQEANLAFQVSGVLQQFPATRGLRVAQGDLIAQLDLRDFQSRLAAQVAQHEQTINEFQSAERAFEQGAMNQLEFTRFRTAVDLALAERELAEKALEDATLLAPFEGIVSDVFVEGFENISVGQRVVRLQDSSKTRVDVNVPEERIVFARRDGDIFRHTVRFDFIPQTEFEATLVEFTTEAAPTTQTFMAIFELEPPESATILPGMTATLIERVRTDLPDGQRVVYIPTSAVATDSFGNHTVWVVEPQGDQSATVRRVSIEAEKLYDDTLIVRSGLEAGQRIATAGVHQLREGQLVRLLSDDASGAPR